MNLEISKIFGNFATFRLLSIIQLVLTIVLNNFSLDAQKAFPSVDT